MAISGAAGPSHHSGAESPSRESWTGSTDSKGANNFSWLSCRGEPAKKLGLRSLKWTFILNHKESFETTMNRKKLQGTTTILQKSIEAIEDHQKPKITRNLHKPSKLVKNHQILQTTTSNKKLAEYTQSGTGKEQPGINKKLCIPKAATKNYQEPLKTSRNHKEPPGMTRNCQNPPRLNRNQKKPPDTTSHQVFLGCYQGQ